jgi:hypothetical protein
MGGGRDCFHPDFGESYFMLRYEIKGGGRSEAQYTLR